MKNIKNIIMSAQLIISIVLMCSFNPSLLSMQQSDLSSLIKYAEELCVQLKKQLDQMSSEASFAVADVLPSDENYLKNEKRIKELNALLNQLDEVGNYIASHPERPSQSEHVNQILNKIKEVNPWYNGIE